MISTSLLMDFSKAFETFIQWSFLATLGKLHVYCVSGESLELIKKLSDELLARVKPIISICS